MAIYAEISNEILKDLENNGGQLNFPAGVVVYSKKGSRAYYLEYDDKKELTDFLDNKGITWQSMDEEKKTKKTKKNKWDNKEKKETREFGVIIDPWNKEKKSKEKKGGFREFGGMSDPWNKNEDN